jgi:hypothetical protein
MLKKRLIISKITKNNRFNNNNYNYSKDIVSISEDQFLLVLELQFILLLKEWIPILIAKPDKIDSLEK